MTSAKGWGAKRAVPADLGRRTEAEILRHLTRLGRKNFYVQAHPMALGGVTAKLPSPLALALSSSFSDLHPSLPPEDLQGILAALGELSHILTELSGFSDLTLQPCGPHPAWVASFKMIQSFFEHHGSHRKVVLVPATVSPQVDIACRVVGLRPERVELSRDGIITPDSVAQSVERHGRDIAALVVCSPNALGLFQTRVQEIADQIHNIGAQVCLEGSNLNGILGMVRIKEMGLDLVQFDLHTFGVPLGGGGWVSCPLAVAPHLAPYLPTPRVVKEGKCFALATPERSIGRVGPPLGPVPLLLQALISLWLAGPEGVRRASRLATLKANYVKRKLLGYWESAVSTPSYHLFAVKGGLEATAQEELVRMGFHPPLEADTGRSEPFGQSFLIEPTETEPLPALQALVQALVGLRRKSHPAGRGQGKEDGTSRARYTPQA